MASSDCVYVYITSIRIESQSSLVYNCIDVSDNITMERKNMNTEPAEPTTNDGLANIRQAEEFLAVSRSTLYVLMDKGDLPYAKIGKSRRIPWKALRDFAERCLVAG
jgi:excisionase family DNA binding protein